MLQDNAPQWNGLASPHLWAPLAKAEDRLARLDETLKSSPIRDGWIARTHYQDAIASLALEGELVHLEDLVLADAEMAVRTPTHELVRAQTYLVTRRQIADNESGWTLSRENLNQLRSGAGEGDFSDDPDVAAVMIHHSANLTRRAEPGLDDTLEDAFAAIDNALANTRSALAGEIRARPPRDPFLYDPDRNDDDDLDLWRSQLEQTRPLPPTLAAAIALDDWDTRQPLQHRPWLGRLITAVLLRQRAKTTAHLACLSVGVRAAPRRHNSMPGQIDRVIFYLDALTAAADHGLADHSRWLTARAGLLRKMKGRRSSSRLPDLIDLVMRRPIVSAGMVASELDVSTRAALDLVADLNLRETTGRGRYRAWGVL
ncbi:RHE_PE00001 family protein [Roseiarcaceae bacterium H3SJ34-1]|uniref:RHE_PE00001 family protein n=1 Tax=Terripilifer ovatus TaxID=3032367 RepID=UPI003AB92664|nr:RHE_PE00001 family protein [Roseiarcaceae bacterium H3SJ34-1]